MRYLLLVASSSSQAFIGQNPVALTGKSANIGYASADVGGGASAELSMVKVFFNGSVSHKQLGEQSLTGASVGLGFGPAVQFQVGGSNQGAFLKVKTEISPFGVRNKEDILQYRVTGNTNIAAKERFTLNLSYEDYRDNSAYNNVNVGLGYAF